MKYVFGPVPSRRLGQSLGIDTIPLKTCNWNCVYCQLGRSKPLTNKRANYVPTDQIISQVREAIETHQPEEIDWLTFVGSGEPTLHSEIGWLIKEVKKITEIPVAVITNGSLLYQKSVRKALVAANAVLPSLDAGSATRYKKINRPHPGVPYEQYIEGLISFRKEFEGNIWLEVMLVQDINDTDDALIEIARKIEQIKPDKIHIGLPTRPPAERWVNPPDEERIMAAISILGKAAQVAPPIDGMFDISGDNHVIDAIIAIITRHPMSEEQLLNALSNFSDEQRKQVIDALGNSGQTQIINRFGQNFWCTTTSVFPDTSKKANM